VWVRLSTIAGLTIFSAIYGSVGSETQVFFARGSTLFKKNCEAFAVVYRAIGTKTSLPAGACSQGFFFFR
jgi:hypothetical protein